MAGNDPMKSEAEIRQLAKDVGALLDQEYSLGAAGEPPRLRGLWEAAIKHGWLDLTGALAEATTVIRMCGRKACPLPVMDAFLAGQLFPDMVDGTLIAFASGAETTVEFAEAGQDADHVLLIPPAGGTAVLRPINSARPMAGLPVPSWSALRLGPPVAERALSPEAADTAVVLYRLGLAARALAAAERTHELAIEYAKTRRQFGKAIGSFGAVQQRIASCQIDVSAAKLLLQDAVQRYPEAGWSLAAELAAEHITAAVPRIQLGAHHTLAASGYFEDGAGPWLFRRAYADLARLRGIRANSGGPGDILVETRTSLPLPRLGEAADRFRSELREFFDGIALPDRAAAAFEDDPEIVAALAGRGLLGIGWPEPAGGRAASQAEQLVLQDEVVYRRLPVGRALGAVAAVGNPLAAHGGTELKERFLPLLRDGKVRICMGYTEAEAGSDLAALRTRAVRDGEQWVINGQKRWITDAHDSDHVWLAARTDPAASPPHAGITVFLVPTGATGITLREHRALSGAVACTIRFQDVRVEDTARVGEVNGGWEVITDALAGERVSMAGLAASLHRQLDDLLEVVRGDRERLAGPRGSAARARLSGLAAAVQAARLLVAAIGGPQPRAAAAMAGVLASELAEDFGSAALEIVGPEAALAGPFEHGLRSAPTFVIGGGTNDIQRGLIARGLGLPR